MDYDDEVLDAEYAYVKKSTFHAHLLSEVLAWAGVVILIVIFIL